MIDDFLQDRAALYVSGAMTEPEREEFELVLEFHAEALQFVCDLQEVAAAISFACVPSDAPELSPELKSKILRAVADQPRPVVPVGFVVTGPNRLVQWVNPAFTVMCGYFLNELRGEKLGPILQGEKTDPAAVSRMRSALHDLRPCRETVLNYHKDGSPYWVDIAITPILDDERQPRWFVAQERLAEPLPA